MTNWEKLIKGRNGLLDWRFVNGVELPDDCFEWLKEVCWTQKKKENKNLNMNSNLVGHIKEEYKILDVPERFESWVCDQSMNPPAYEWWKHHEFLTENKPIVFENLWCNFQKKTEFNPPHTHSGFVSFVIFVQVPYNLEEEDKLWPDLKVDEKTQQCTSRFQLLNVDVGGKITTDALNVDKSFEGKMLMFPNTQMHQVFPFYTSDEYRITVSGNLRFKV